MTGPEQRSGLDTALVAPTPTGAVHHQSIVIRVLLIMIAAAAWWVLYRNLEPIAKWLTYGVFSMSAGSRISSAVEGSRHRKAYRSANSRNGHTHQA